MNIHLYTSESTYQATGLIQCINNARHYQDNITIINIDFDNINYESNIKIDDLIILMISNYDDLNNLIKIKDNIARNLVIIVLKENNDEIINKSYLLNPRFIEFIDGNYHRLAEIINKISAQRAKSTYLQRSSHCACHRQGGSL